jgi:hypothetical protein
MKNVAILMKGMIGSASGSFRHKINNVNGNANAHLDHCDYVNYTACYNSIKKHIIEANTDYSFDFYLHSWHPDLSEKLNELYSPVASIHEDNAKYVDIIKEKARYAGDENRWFSQASFALSIKRVTELFEKHQEKNYDLVIFYRYDVLLWKDMLLSQYDLKQNHVYSNHYPKGDFHFVMNHATALEFGLQPGLFDSLSSQTLPKDHKMVQLFVKNNLKRELHCDNVIVGQADGGYQEVLRKLKELGNKKLSEIPLEDYGLTHEEVDSYNEK